MFALDDLTLFGTTAALAVALFVVRLYSKGGYDAVCAHSGTPCS